jgi:hypothetical protein
MACRFTTFQDAPVVVGVNNVPFSTPGVDNTKGAYLSLCVDPDLSTGSSVTLNVWINTTQLSSEMYTSEAVQVWQQNIPAGVLQPANTLTLIRAGGLAQVSVSDCVVHYKT